ncbi:MAG: hypothetical protein Q8L06_11135 [Pseudohongiella sp.]|nr:hypothetical protein [Pseudohongiella sp.]
MSCRKMLCMATGVLAITLIASALSVLIAMTSARLDIQAQLAEQLPERLSEALRYSFADREVFAHVNQQISEDLARVRIMGLLPVLESCQTRLIRLTQHAPENHALAAGTGNIAVNWSRGVDIDQAEFAMDCQINYTVVIGSHVAIALMLMGLWSLLPAPLGTDQKRLNDVLLDHGIPAPAVQQILQKTNPGQLQHLIEDPWFILAMRKFANAEINLDSAFAITASAPTVAFFHSAHQVVIHGIAIILPKTPYFYFAWYALQRRQNTQEGWILNPAVDRPDRRLATTLINLMERFGGHQKAINDLKEHGLRSKILDQNRNKIKEELVAALGDELAAGFLFETERDSRSSRYRYRLCCPPSNILLDTPTF